MGRQTLAPLSRGAVLGAAALTIGLSGQAVTQNVDEEYLYFEIDVTAPDDSASATQPADGPSPEARALETGIGEPGRSAVDGARLQRQYSGSGLATVLTDFAGVDTGTDAGDPNISISVRGLSDDGRVAVTIDGARQNFSRQGHGIGGTFTADPETLRTVEVIRGPAGTDAGAGAYAGTVALRTIEARDLIAPDATTGGEARLRFGTLYERPTFHLSYAALLGSATEALIAVTTREDRDYTAPDGTEVRAAEETLSTLTKVSHDFGGDRRLTFSLSTNGSDYETGQIDVDRINRRDATNAILNYTMPALGGLPALDLTLYRTDTRVAQRRLDDDGDPFGEQRSYRTLTIGARAQANVTASTGALDHDLTFVIDGFRDDVSVDDPTATGGSLTAPGTRDIRSLIAEDLITLSPRTDVVLGLRYDSYALSSDDADSNGSQWSPSLTLRHRIGPVTLHASAARSFRPPTVSEALVDGQHPEPADFFIRPNPDLRPESATTFEVGATVRLDELILPGDRLDARLALYQSDITDYIGLSEPERLFDLNRQYENIDEARIRGGELELSYDADVVFGRFAGQFAQGTNLEDDSDLSGVAPDGYTLTAGWRNPDRTLEIGARYTHADAREDGTDSSDDWDRYDLFLNKEFDFGALFTLALNNITDATYTRYRTTLPAPGFNATASFSFKF